MTTANEIIQGALKRSGSYSPGEPFSAVDSADALETLNDLLDSLSTDQASVFASSENIFTFTPGKAQYTIGNYTSTNTFTGTLVNGSPTISGVTVPSDLIARADIIVQGVGLAAGTVATVIGANTVTISPVANQTVATPQVFNFTVPGDLKMERPLRVTDSFTRITTQGSGLDYPIKMVSQDRYTGIGFKNIPAPWPILAWYNPTMPLGNIFFYQNPSTAGELHLFTDNILTNFQSLTTNVLLPRGYVRALKWLLCKELCAVNRYPVTKTILDNAKESYDFIKSLNEVPVPVSTYDSEIIANNRYDASWIMTGGFR